MMAIAVFCAVICWRHIAVMGAADTIDSADSGGIWCHHIGAQRNLRA